MPLCAFRDGVVVGANTVPIIITACACLAVLFKLVGAKASAASEPARRCVYTVATPHDGLEGLT